MLLEQMLNEFPQLKDWKQAEEMGDQATKLLVGRLAELINEYDLSRD